MRSAADRHPSRQLLLGLALCALCSQARGEALLAEPGARLESNADDSGTSNAGWQRIASRECRCAEACCCVRDTGQGAATITRPPSCVVVHGSCVCAAKLQIKAHTNAQLRGKAHKNTSLHHTVCTQGLHKGVSGRQDRCRTASFDQIPGVQCRPALLHELFTQSPESSARIVCSTISHKTSRHFLLHPH